MKSKRKPFNDRAGYIASRINPLTGIHNVIYIASEQGIDTGGIKYAVVCEAHNKMISTKNIPDARNDMKNADVWCEDCRQINNNLEYRT